MTGSTLAVLLAVWPDVWRDAEAPMPAVRLPVLDYSGWVREGGVHNYVSGEIFGKDGLVFGV